MNNEGKLRKLLGPTPDFLDENYWNLKKPFTKKPGHLSIPGTFILAHKVFPKVWFELENQLNWAEKHHRVRAGKDSRYFPPKQTIEIDRKLRKPGATINLAHELMHKYCEHDGWLISGEVAPMVVEHMVEDELLKIGKKTNMAEFNFLTCVRNSMPYYIEEVPLEGPVIDSVGHYVGAVTAPFIHDTIKQRKAELWKVALVTDDDLVEDLEDMGATPTRILDSVKRYADEGEIMI